MSSPAYPERKTRLYLRPIEALPPGTLNNCARWLVLSGNWDSYRQAVDFLVQLEQNDIQRYKSYISAYYQANERHRELMKYIDINTYRSSAVNTYGEEPHMYYSKI